MTDRSAFACVVLAAGRSSRMGATKQLIDVGGCSMVRRAVETALALSFAHVVVVLGHDADAVRAELVGFDDSRLRFVMLENADQGQAASLAAAISALNDDGEGIIAAAVLLADQPGLSGETIGCVLDAWSESEADVLRPLFNDVTAYVPGHPVVFGREVWGELSALSGDDGVRRWMRGAGDAVAEVRFEIPATPDVDTPADLAAARRTTAAG